MTSDKMNQLSHARLLDEVFSASFSIPNYLYAEGESTTRKSVLNEADSF